MTMIRFLPVALVFSMLAALPATAAAPLLRPAVEIDGTHVRLGDLFENPGGVGDQVVFPAPAPGEIIRLSIADAFDLAASHGLGWQPLAPFDHVIITRAWRLLERDEVMLPLEAALGRAGAGRRPGERIDIDLPARAVQVKVARGALADIAIEDVAYDERNGRFQATVVVRDSFREPRRQLVAGRAHIVVDLPVLRSRLRPDQVVRADDVEMRSFRSERVPANALTDPAAFVGLSPKRSLTPGRPVLADDLGPPIIVTRGALVTMQVINPNMRLMATGRAQEPGALGDAIRVQNIQSRLVIEAVVTGPGQVAVQLMTYDIVAR